MLKSLERLQQLISRPSHAYRPTMETFPDLDVRRIAQEMELKKLGAARGGVNQPDASSASLDATETEIVELIGAAQKRAHDSVENHIAGFRQRLVDLDFEAQFSNIRAATLGGLSDLKQELQTGIDDLHGHRRDLVDAEKWQASFRRTHRLERPSKRTSVRGAFFKWTVIVILVLLELVTNGELLSKGSELGLVGGIIESLIFTALNVGVALLLAIYALPYLAHRNFILKLVGLLALVSYLGFMLGLNLALAHYREVSGALTEGAGQEVMIRLLSAPLELADFRSWLLFGLGVLFSVIAAIDGLALRDHYPGYSTVTKHLKSTRTDYADMRRAAIEELGAVRKDYEGLLTTARSDLSKQRGEHDAIVSHRSRMISLFDQHQDQLEKAANVLLREYRDANVTARSSPAPVRFVEAYVLPRVEVMISKEGEWNSEELRSRINEAQAEVDQLFTHLTKAFDEALTRYRELDVLAADEA